MSRFFSNPFRKDDTAVIDDRAMPGRAGADRFGDDPITQALINSGGVRLKQAEQARRYASGERPVWRVLLTMDGVDRAKTYEIAARVQGYPLAELGAHPKDEFVQAVLGLMTPDVLQRTSTLGLLPYKFGFDAQTRAQRLVLATHDPSSPDVIETVELLGGNVELCYADEREVRRRLDRAMRSMGNASPSDSSAGDSSDAARLSSETPSMRPHQSPPSASEQPSRRIPSPAHDSLPRPDGAPPTPSWEKVKGTDVAAPSSDSASASPPPQPPDVPSFQATAPTTQGAPSTSLSGLSGDGASSRTPDAVPSPTQARDRVVAMLLRKQIVHPDQVDAAHEASKAEGSKEALWRAISKLDGVDRDAIFAEAAQVYAFPEADLDEGQPTPEFVRSVMATFDEVKRKRLLDLSVVPAECDVDTATGAVKLIFVTYDPARPEVHRAIHALKLERYELQYAPEALVTKTLRDAYPRKNEYLEKMEEGGGVAFDLGATFEDEGGLDEEALEAEIGRSTLINLFEATLVEAVRQGVSDIHVWPNAKGKVEIHFRLDGALKRWHTEENIHPEALLAVIKDNASNVDRFERDKAQDGFIQRRIDDALIRFRVSVLPIATASQEVRAESIVIRILDDRKVVTDLNKLGMLPNAMERFEMAIRQPHGMVILTGPTGSGKSTTLVAALHQVVSPTVNVLTVEDPVEYIIHGVRQIKLSHKLGLEGALRAILRHDPDVVMVGEMRDKETAEMGVKLANTGHLTFSTLHTNDAPSAVSRLYKMGVEPFLIAYAINLIVAQRLIRTLCESCKQVDDDPDPVLMERMGFTPEDQANTLYRANPKGCAKCNGGYKGRRAITEALYFSRAIRHMIVTAKDAIDEDAIRTQAEKEGMLTLQDSARVYATRGVTSLDEMMRVTASEG